MLAMRLDLHGGGGVARPAGVLDPPPPWFTTGAWRAGSVIQFFLQVLPSKKGFQEAPADHTAAPPPRAPGAAGPLEVLEKMRFAREGCQNPTPKRSRTLPRSPRTYKTVQDAPQDGPRGSQDAQNGLRELQETPKTAQNGPRYAPEAPKTAQEAPKTA